MQSLETKTFGSSSEQIGHAVYDLTSFCISNHEILIEGCGYLKLVLLLPCVHEHRNEATVVQGTSNASQSRLLQQSRITTLKNMSYASLHKLDQ